MNEDKSILLIPDDKIRLTISSDRLDVPLGAYLSKNQCKGRECELRYSCLYYRLWRDYSYCVSPATVLRTDRKNESPCYKKDIFESCRELNVFRISTWSEEEYRENLKYIIESYSIL